MDSQLTIALDGELTIYRAAELREQLLTACGEPSDVELELDEVTEVDTAGIQLLLSLRAHLANRGGRLVLGKVSAAVGDTLALYRLGDLFQPGEGTA